MENSTSNPRRHSTMPEFFSRMSMSCNRLTNLFSLGWLRRSRLFWVLLLFCVATFEEEFGSGVTGMDPNLSFSLSRKEWNKKDC